MAMTGGRGRRYGENWIGWMVDGGWWVGEYVENWREKRSTTA